MRVLLLEDDDLLGDGVRAALAQKGHAADWARDGEEALAALETAEPDAVVLDLGLPGIGGLEVLRRMRASGRATPVLILTARDTVAERVRGLDAGADDYLVKPFDVAELLARLRALARRRGGRAAPVLRHGAIVLDPGAHAVTKGGVPVELSAREFAIAEELLGNAGRVLSKERLEEKLYGWGDEIASNAIEVHVHHLRRKLGADLIRTIRGVGYLVDEDRA
jgi:DNA-binding response OmpR family regulator